MSLPPDYLTYPRRALGMDQDRYAYSPLPSRKPVEWPGGARIALWIIPSLQFFPLDMTGKPFKTPGALERPYPDYWNYTLRDYGNRVGFHRVFKALDTHGLKASVAINSRLAERHPYLLSEIVRRGWEVIAHGADMGKLLHGGLNVEEETALIAESLSVLRKASGQPVAGWLSPGQAESRRTPDLLAAAGVRYVCDWTSDDMPFALNTTAGPLCAMPYGLEISDTHLILTARQSAAGYAEQVLAQFDFLYREAEKQGGRIMALPLHPWLIGVPHRIAALEKVLAAISSRAGVWSATGVEIFDCFNAQSA
jgi:allantoinase